MNRGPVILILGSMAIATILFVACAGITAIWFCLVFLVICLPAVCAHLSDPQPGHVQSCKNWPKPHYHHTYSTEWAGGVECPFEKLRRVQSVQSRMTQWRQQLRNAGASEEETKIMEGFG